jgi:vancomycin resistance protein YoaR
MPKKKSKKVQKTRSKSEASNDASSRASSKTSHLHHKPEVLPDISPRVLPGVLHGVLLKKLWPPAHWLTAVFLAIGIVFVVIVSTIVAIHFLFLDKIYPGVSIAGVDVSGLTPNEAQTRLSQVLTAREQQKLPFSIQMQRGTTANVIVDLSDNGTIDFSQPINQAFLYGHSQFYSRPININLNLGTILDKDLDQVESQINQPPIDSNLAIDGDEITVSPSQPGFVLNREDLKKNLTTYLNSGKLPTQFLEMQSADPKLSYEAALRIKNRLDQLKQNPIKLTYQDQTFPLELKDVLPMIDLQNSQDAISLKSDGDQGYIATLASKIDAPVKEPLFNFDPSSPNRIKQFQPPTEGHALDRQKTLDLLTQELNSNNQNAIALPVNTVVPENKLTNDLGIKELIGHGESNFGGSIDNRIFNVKLAASRLNGVLVSPDEEFSFNKTVGDISAATGYKQAYVIKSGHTVLDDGGGVCQVSTTLFRAILNSGLLITARTAHAYRVHYYENGGYPPGVDATTYYPSVDFKFKNDTGHYILVQAYYEGLNLYVDLYGTSDGRVSTVTKPIITSSTPAPPDIRQDDPTLPKGTVKQVDWAAAGANVVFKRTVVRNGQTIIDESFHSNYRPWQAVYLVGTKEG